MPYREGMSSEPWEQPWPPVQGWDAEALSLSCSPALDLAGAAGVYLVDLPAMYGVQPGGVAGDARR